MPVQKASDVANYSNAYNSRAKLFIPGKKDIEFWLKTYNLPDITVQSQSVPGDRFDIKVPGSRQTFGAFSATIFLDESFVVYQSLYDWVMNGTPWGEEFKSSEITAYLYILNNSYTKVIKTITFYGLFPTNIAGINYNMFSGEEIALDTTFDYTKYTLK